MCGRILSQGIIKHAGNLRKHIEVTIELCENALEKADYKTTSGMKKYSPKPDLWSKILDRKEFDSQVQDHVINLPERMPKADLWNAIENELDRKKPLIPLLKYGLTAASIALILALSGIAYLQFGGKTQDTQLITEVSMPSAEIESIDKNLEGEIEPDVVRPEASIQEISKTDTSQKKLPQREKIAPIELPELDLEELTIENTFVSELIIPTKPEVEAPKTLHKVRISWGIQDKSKLRTTFGSGAPEDISERKIGRVDETSNSIKIIFKKQ